MFTPIFVNYYEKALKILFWSPILRPPLSPAPWDNCPLCPSLLHWIRTAIEIVTGEIIMSENENDLRKVAENREPSTVGKPGEGNQQVIRSGES